MGSDTMEINGTEILDTYAEAFPGLALTGYYYRSNTRMGVQGGS